MLPQCGQYASAVRTARNLPPQHSSGRSHVRTFPTNSLESELVHDAYRDLVTEKQIAFDDTKNTTLVFAQHQGPFTDYRREITSQNGVTTETTHWTLDVPWFGWIFQPLVKRHIMRRRPGKRHPWWAPPQVFTAREVFVLAMLAVASMSAAFVNTLFTQTVAYAADDFDITARGQGIAGAVVRIGIVLAIPLAVLGDKVGRKRVVVVLAFLTPIVASLGALAPNFEVLVATQTIARPMGLAFDVAIMVIVVEEMPRFARAYGLSILALASGLGAGFAVLMLPLADLGTNGWRLIYVAALLWLIVAVSLRRRLTETNRFVTHSLKTVAPISARKERETRGRKLDRAAVKTLLVVGSVAFLANIFVATASIFQNRYLKDVRDYSASMVALFTLATATPAGIGLIAGGKLAEKYGRRFVAAFTIPVGALLLALSFVASSALMWGTAIVGGIIASIAYPAMAVYRGELFPTGSRTTSSFFITVAALLGGSIGLVLGGSLIDSGWSYGAVMLTFATVSLVVTALVLGFFPETANTELEELHPQDLSTSEET